MFASSRTAWATANVTMPKIGESGVQHATIRIAMWKPRQPRMMQNVWHAIPGLRSPRQKLPLTFAAWGRKIA
jgi:hypothetical protein